MSFRIEAELHRTAVKSKFLWGLHNKILLLTAFTSHINVYIFTQLVILVSQQLENNSISVPFSGCCVNKLITSL
jgi:hypothetical protein